MATFDWIVVGNGIAGAAVSYELQKAGLSVLVVDSGVPDATRFSYGGIAYWAATSDPIRQLCQEGIEYHRQLSAQLDADTQFRELNLLLTIASNRDPEVVAKNYMGVLIPPTLLSPEAACEIEPLLNPAAISAALLFPYGQVSPEAMVAAYNQAFLRLGGKIETALVTSLVQQGRQVQGVVTAENIHLAANVVICAGAMTRSLLNTNGLSTRVYFTHAEIIETDPVELQLQSLVMPAEMQRSELEAKAGAAETDTLWNESGHEIAPAILDSGVVQLQDGRLRIGQLSRTLTDPTVQVDSTTSETALRQAIGQILPTLEQIPGRWCRCRVAFSGDRLPIVGAIPAAEGIHVFTGFSNPFAILPPLARRFAQAATGAEDAILNQLSPDRFVKAAEVR